MNLSCHGSWEMDRAPCPSTRDPPALGCAGNPCLRAARLLFHTCGDLVQTPRCGCCRKALLLAA